MSHCLRHHRVALLGLGLLISGPAWAQLSPTAGRNYTIEQVPRTGQTAVTPTSSYTDVPATVSYFDGLGRPRQTLQVRGAGDASKDIATQTQTYDLYGRPQQTFLPLPGSNASGNVQDDPQGSGQTFYGDPNPFVQTVYENSPLNRPSQQYGAGSAWRVADRKTSIRYGVAPASSIMRFKVNFFSNTIYANIENQSATEYFGPRDVATRTITDEQNNVTVEYMDVQGRVIRRDVQTNGQTLTTMYLYDQYERLGAVLPPKIYEWFRAAPMNQILYFYLNSDPNQPNPDFKDNCFAYLYDARGRAIRKHVPSAGWTDLVYDRQDRLVLSQDEQDRASGRLWRFTEYDGLSRPVTTGRTSVVPSDRSADLLRTDFAGVSHETFPATVPTPPETWLIQNQYDNYDNSSQTYQSSGAFSTPWPNARGLLTVSRIRNLDTQVLYGRTQFYDDKGRVVQQQRHNHLGGLERTDMQYRFNGELLQSVLRHENVVGGNGVVTPVTSLYRYDHWGRRLGLTHQVGSNTATSLADYSYDGIGRMVQKRFQPGVGGGTGQPVITRNQNPTIPTQDVASQYVEITPGSFDVNLQNNPSGLYEARIGAGGAGSALQTLDYRYHIRGWLRGVNVDANGQPQLDAGQGDSFGFGLDYETAGQYDGNIGRQQWLGSRQPGQTRQYTYQYDGAKRITGATYAGASGENYTLSGMSYDRNGNILSLNRANIDQLTYTYGAGNSLTAVSDASGNTAGFADGNTSGADYSYWPEGSIRKDLNRGISDVQYNLLKLPGQVSFTSGKIVRYQYDAEGTKLKMSVQNGEGRDYIGPFQYLTPNGGSRSLFEISTEEGRYTSASGYEYYHRDHLGNVRAVQGQSGVSQWTDYDPWGLELSGLSSGNSTSRARFNGQEAIAEIGAGYLDFGARGYDATIGRWGVVDPLAEVSRRWSPFVFGYNNPVQFVDPDGMLSESSQQPEPNRGFQYSDGYSTQDSRFTTGSVQFDGAYQTNGGGGEPQQGGGGQEPVKGGGFPKGEIRSTADQNATLRPADGLKYTESERAGHEGVYIGAEMIATETLLGAIFRPIVAATGRLIGELIGTRSTLAAKAKDIAATINTGQQGKHIVGHNNYIPGRSVLTTDASNLLNDVRSGNVRSIQSINSAKNRVEFKSVIGNYIDPVTNTPMPTTRAIIHSGKNGAHIIPSSPK